jgi:hypothetical protein
MDSNLTAGVFSSSLPCPYDAFVFHSEIIGLITFFNYLVNVISVNALS